MNISMGLMVCIGISAALAVGLPLALGALGKIRLGRAFPMGALALGAVSFVVAVLVLEQLLHTAVLAAFPGLVLRPAAYTLYGCVAAGLFEESARYVCLRLWCKRKPAGVGLALAYGVGHGGVESILLAGAPLVSSLVLLISAQGKTAAQLTQMLGDAHTAQLLEEQVASLSAAPAWLNLLSGYERVVALALHLALSVLVWMAAAGWLPRWFVGVSMALHALANVPAGLAQTGVITDLVLVEALITLASALAVWYVCSLYKKARALQNCALSGQNMANP